MERWDFLYIPEGGALSLDGCGQNVATTIAATGSHRPAEEIETNNGRKSDRRAIMERTACEAEDRQHLSKAYRIMTPYKILPQGSKFDTTRGRQLRFQKNN